ncbi:MAG TPA: aminotransferase class I/II-fold pyridoxal phosphate-dependent enzyme, partial [Planctomycetes bacterium]|nr:aminotransferase class I/II-fold pyridoxal phosphate-dependent enzyme [Planctomycetota bacterium]
QANLGAISAIAGKNDLVLCDRENHASIIDGCRLSFADMRKYRHNDVEDLERHLQLAKQQDRAIMIVVDGLYSMMGDLAPLTDIS